MNEKEVNKIPLRLFDLLDILPICYKLKKQVRLFEKEINLFSYVITLIENEEARIWKGLEESFSLTLQ